MSNKEKVLAIRPEAVCEQKIISPKYHVYRWEIKLDNVTIGHSYLSEEEEAWAAAYKYLTK